MIQAAGHGDPAPVPLQSLRLSGWAVVDRRACSPIRFQLECLFTGNQSCNHALRVIEIAEVNGLPLAADNAEGLEALVYPMDTEIALLHPVFPLTEKNSIIGAGIHTCLASVALLLIQDNRPILPFYKGISGAGIQAGWLLTVHAGLRQKRHLQIGEDSLRGILLFDVDRLDANPVPCRCILNLAGNGTRLASDTSLLFDNQSQSLFHLSTSSNLTISTATSFMCMFGSYIASCTGLMTSCVR